MLQKSRYPGPTRWRAKQKSTNNMKKLLPALITVVALTPSARAQTAFNGGDFGTVGNWSHGLPTSVENPGTVAFNGTMLANPATIKSPQELGVSPRTRRTTELQ